MTWAEVVNYSLARVPSKQSYETNKQSKGGEHMTTLTVTSYDPDIFQTGGIDGLDYEQTGPTTLAFRYGDVVTVVTFSSLSYGGGMYGNSVATEIDAYKYSDLTTPIASISGGPFTTPMGRRSMSPLPTLRWARGRRPPRSLRGRIWRRRSISTAISATYSREAGHTPRYLRGRSPPATVSFPRSQ